MEFSFFLQTILFFLVGFSGMEIFSYAVHRWLFHGIFWRIHSTHHLPRKFFLELNDIFSLFFAAVSIFFIFFGNNIFFALGLGIAFYGLAYFITHDLFTHRRFFPFFSTNKVLLTIRSAHQKHHQSAKKKGLEPFGLFLFNYFEFWKNSSK